MKLVFKQFVALLLGFGLMWGALSAIRWTQWLRIEENTQATEDKIGDGGIWGFGPGGKGWVGHVGDRGGGLSYRGEGEGAGD